MLFEEDTSTHFLKASHVPVDGTEHALVSSKIDAVMLNAEARAAQRARGPELSRRDIVVGHSLESHVPSSMAGMREGSFGRSRVAALILLAALWTSDSWAGPADTTARALVADWKDADPGMAAVAEVIASAFASGLTAAGFLPAIRPWGQTDHERH